MSKLDRLFTQALAGDDAGRRGPSAARPRAPPPPEEEDVPPVDETEAERILAAFKRSDYAGCLKLAPVTLDDIGRPAWAVTDACVHSRAARARAS